MECAETPVTVRCDFPQCGETEWMLTVTTTAPDNLPSVRQRAADAMFEVATGSGWHIDLVTGAALCPHHAHPARVVLL